MASEENDLVILKCSECNHVAVFDPAVLPSGKSRKWGEGITRNVCGECVINGVSHGKARTMSIITLQRGARK